MDSSVNAPTTPAQPRIYASLTVIDGERQLKPAEVGFDRIRFRVPPQITSEQVEIILRNGDHTQRHLARVLPHDLNAMQIPIQVLSLLPER